MARNLSHTGAGGPAVQVAQVTPDDGVDFAEGPTRCLYVGVAGALKIRDARGNEAVLISAACQYHPIRASRVMATGTTATDIVALW